MPRSAKLKLVFVKSRNRWKLEVPKSLSDTGNRRQLFFTNKTEAVGACELLKTRKHNLGALASSLPAPKIAKATEAFQILDPLGIDLLDAVRSHVALVKARGASIPLGEAFDRYIESKQTKTTSKYLQEIRYAKATFSPLLQRLVCDITHSDLESILERFSNASRNAKQRRLRSVFGFAIKRGWMKDGTNPVSKLDFAQDPRKEVEIFPVDAVRKLLNYTLENDLESLPYRVFTFFCGIRPEGEMERLNWSDVRIDQKTVVLRAEITKTRRKRFVDLSDNAIAWLLEYRSRGGAMTGLVAPWPLKTRKAKHSAGYKAAGFGKWIQQGARHSFCSYWLGLHKDINRLVLLSGHTNVDMMWRRYHQGVTESEAAKYWSIMPPVVDASNVVAFQQSA